MSHHNEACRAARLIGENPVRAKTQHAAADTRFGRNPAVDSGRNRLRFGRTYLSITVIWSFTHVMVPLENSLCLPPGMSVSSVVG